MKREGNEDFWEGIGHIPKPRNDKYDHEEMQEDLTGFPMKKYAPTYVDVDKALSDCEASEHKLNPEYEMTKENEFDSVHKNPDSKTVEREFKTTFSYKYNVNRREGKKLIYVTTETVDQGKDAVRIQLFKSYPNLEIHSIIHKED